MAIESMPWAAAASTSSVIRPRPSSRLNSVWAWRWVKSLGARVTGANGSRRTSEPRARPPTTGGSLTRVRRRRKRRPITLRDVNPDMEPLIDDHDLEALVVDALERLPEPFRERLGSVAIVVEEEPTPDQLASVRAHGLYGLYQGVPRTAWGA